MKKIPTIFIRNPDNLSEVLNERNPVCEWVFNGEGVPTRKFDGTAMKFERGQWFKRYDCKKGRTAPDGFESADEPDLVTGHWPGWVPIGDGPEDKWHRAAIWQFSGHQAAAAGTYEAIGPHFQGNPECVDSDTLVRHGLVVITNLGNTVTIESLVQFFTGHPFEGIVWHHPDGRMAKIKARDFRIKRGKV